MFNDDWDLDAHHEDIQNAYHRLRAIHPSLGAFREPRSTDSETVKRILNNLRIFMCHYHLLFPEFVDFEHESVGGTRYETQNESQNGGTGKLRRMVDPLLTFCQRLEKKLNEAEEDYDGFGEIFMNYDGQVYDENGVDGWRKDSTAANPPTPTSNKSRNNSSKSSSSKRSSDDPEENSSPKKSKVTPFKPATQANQLASRTFTKFTSAPQASATASTSRPCLYKISAIPRPLPRTISTSTESTEYIESSTTTTTTSTTTSTVVTPSTSFSTLPPAVPSRPSSVPTPHLSLTNSSLQAIKITNDNYIASLNRLGIKFHFQWELERLISQHDTVTWDSIEWHALSSLKDQSSTEMVHLIDTIIRQAEAKQQGAEQVEAPRRRDISDRKALMLSEVDKEEISILAKDLRGVGNNSVDWPYGGKIQYILSVQLATKGEGCSELPPEILPASQANDPYRRKKPLQRAQTLPSAPTVDWNNPMGPGLPSTAYEPRSFPFRFELRQPEMPGKSFRLARRFGSRRCISLKTKDIPLNKRKELKEMLTGRCLIVLGRPYRAFWAAPDGENVMLIETPEEGNGVVTKGREDEPKMPSFQELLYRYNDLNKKPNQAMAKWAARPQILFSDSVPVTSVELSAIHEIPDIITREAQLSGRPETEQILTDGCGLMSESLALRIYHHPSLTLTNGRPSVVQMRIGGSKGLLALMSPNQGSQHPSKEILLRDSMIKTLSASNYENDPSLLTVDVLKCESLKIGANLSSEAIIAMAHNGVPTEVFVKMAENELNSLRDAFWPTPLEGETEDDMFRRIFASCYGIGGVGMDNKKRQARKDGKSLRAAGLAKGHFDDDMEVDEDDEDPLTISASERFDVDPISGQPNSLGEALMESVASGFHPATSPYPASKLHHVVETLSKKIVRDFKIPVQQSLTAFIVPDSLQILAPDELFICFSSKGPIDETTQIPLNYLEGEVLAYRSPCKVPTDVRRLRAVYKPELAYLKDCIVLSANSQLCKRSPASYLGGGDYDGDTLTLFWNTELVQHFRNAEDHFAETPPNFEEQNFHKSVTKGTEFLDGIEGLSANEKIRELQSWLIDGVKGDELTGIYSGLHENAVYTLGYDHPETIRLARMFCHVLDARKSGLRVKDEVLRDDRKKYGGDLDWRLWKKGDETVNIRNVNYLKRRRELGGFIMDKLKTKGEEHRKKVMGSFLREPPTLTDQEYREHGNLWEATKNDQQMSLIPIWQQQLEKIESHVKACCEIRQYIVQGRCEDVAQTYQNLLNGVIPRLKSRPQNGLCSPIKQRKVENSESSLERLTKIRQLAVIWRDYPRKEEIPSLFTSWEIGQRKLSCLAGMLVGKNRSMQMAPFDLDFTGFCDMQARSNGKNARTILSTIYEDLKPATRAQSKPGTA
ncbi:hypothetical protein I302_102172 [Kwoniella bestiolae CBS 10118]|uniref:RNA-dependent RNA polymerase n=1 Tax=Kwoniella bestiolae CBS 10118 TaxID=1296100 RepID=A0AAJ8K3D4_9TREE